MLWVLKIYTSSKIKMDDRAISQKKNLWKVTKYKYTNLWLWNSRGCKLLGRNSVALPFALFLPSSSGYSPMPAVGQDAELARPLIPSRVIPVVFTCCQENRFPSWSSCFTTVVFYCLKYHKLCSIFFFQIVVLPHSTNIATYLHI